MDSWGSKMLVAVETAAEMAARGFGLEPDAFTRRMRLGPHLLAPTGASLTKGGCACALGCTENRGILIPYCKCCTALLYYLRVKMLLSM